MVSVSRRLERWRCILFLMSYVISYPPKYKLVDSASELFETCALLTSVHIHSRTMCESIVCFRIASRVLSDILVVGNGLFDHDYVCVHKFCGQLCASADRIHVFGAHSIFNHAFPHVPTLHLLRHVRSGIGGSIVPSHYGQCYRLFLGRSSGDRGALHHFGMHVARCHASTS
jgi:hypothetical protein